MAACITYSDSPLLPGLKEKTHLMTLRALTQTLSIPKADMMHSCHEPSHWAWGFPFRNIKWAACPQTEDISFFSPPRFGEKQRKTCTAHCDEDTDRSCLAAKADGFKTRKRIHLLLCTWTQMPKPRRQGMFRLLSTRHCFRKGVFVWVLVQNHGWDVRTST